ncbi:sigma-70 family RNA polymerase sigma factor [Vibrio breoganii]
MLAESSYLTTKIDTEKERRDKEAQILIDNASLLTRLVNYYVSVRDDGEAEEFRQIASLVLIMEYRRFGHVDSEEFRQAAQYRMRAEIRDELRRRDPLSRGARQSLNALNEAEKYLASKLYKQPTNQQVCEYMGISLGELAELRRKDVVESDLEIDQLSHEAETHEDAVLMAKAVEELNNLDEITKRLLYLVYVEGLSNKEAAMVLDLCPVQAHRLQGRGLKIIKRKMVEE